MKISGERKWGHFTAFEHLHGTGMMMVAISKLTNPFDVNAQHFDNPSYELLL